ncbi:MAG: hypothetical protein HOP96_05175 [Sphingomonas sp.]|nr:hypothetical protein [Sphingomonas sp.]
MSNLVAPVAAAALVAGLAAVPLNAALAQSSNDRVNEIIVFGTDPCPRSTDDEVVVCKRVGEEERYRIPQRLREGGSLQQRTAWANKVRSIERVGRTGIQSCSPVGPAGYTGCMEQMINQAREESRESTTQQTAPEE